jgi:hypothetical protein
MSALLIASNDDCFTLLIEFGFSMLFLLGGGVSGGGVKGGFSFNGGCNFSDLFGDDGNKFISSET